MLQVAKNSPGTRWALLAGAVGLALSHAALGASPARNWPQWGGPSRDFKSPAQGLADRWPVNGPRRIWSRAVGDGYASVVTDAERLYTMYREGDDEVAIALQADTGKTAWEHRYPAPTYESQTAAYGQGPNATPLIQDGKLITIGFTGIMHCLDGASGKVLWRHDLVKDFDGRVQYYGYSNSPLSYKGTIITQIGGESYGVVGLDPRNGKLLWKSKPYEISYAAPVLINVDGQDQYVFFSPDQVIGLDPKNGAYLWSHKVVNFCRTNCTSVVWGDDNLLWAATKGVGGTRVLKLTQRDGKTSVEQVWVKRKIRVYHWNAVRVGDYMYTSSGDRSMLLSTIDVKTGKVVDRVRGFGSTNGIYADGKLILLDDGGKLALADVADGELKIVSSAQILDSLCCTPPTLVDKTLYVRDRSGIMALDLGVQEVVQVP